jgi:hypothetical protein
MAHTLGKACTDVQRPTGAEIGVSSRLHSGGGNGGPGPSPAPAARYRRGTPRPLHKKATSSSSLQFSQRIRAKPCASPPHSRYLAKSLSIPGQASPHFDRLGQQRGEVVPHHLVQHYSLRPLPPHLTPAKPVQCQCPAQQPRESLLAASSPSSAPASPPASGATLVSSAPTGGASRTSPPHLLGGGLDVVVIITPLPVEPGRVSKNSRDALRHNPRREGEKTKVPVPPLRGR